MGERLKALRIALGITQSEFARRISITRNFISLIESGLRIPSDRTIQDICREFRVDEIWLRTGEGSMFRPMSRSDELAAFFGDIQSRIPDFRVRLISVMSELTDEEWEYVERKARKLFVETQKDEP